MKIVFFAFDIDDTISKRKIDSYFNTFPERFLNSFFIHKYYGEDVKELEIAAIILKMHPGYENWHIPKRPKYYYYHFSHIIAGNPPIIWNKRFTIETRLSNEDYNALITADSDEADAIIAKVFYRALDQLDKLPKRLKDFDKEGFKRDVEALFRSHGWL